jgi:excisionase family DNA binding protein
MNDRALTVKEVAARYGIGTHTVLHWIASGQLSGAVNVGRSPSKRKPRWRIPQSALDSFELSRTATPPERVRRRKPSEQVTEFYK